MTKLYAVTGEDVVRLTKDASDSWEMTSRLSGVGAQCLAIDPDDPRRLIAGTFDDGVFLSTDGGESWNPAGEDIPHKRILSVAVSPSRKVNGANALYAGTEPSSLYASEDGGITWQDMPALRDLPSAPTWSFPPRPWTSHVRWIAPSWHEPDLLFAGIELGGVMRSTDGGETWEDRKAGSYHDSHCILTHPKDGNRVYEAAGGGVAMSLDAGETWQEVDDGMDRHYAWSLAIDPENSDLWFVSASFSARYAHRDDESSEAIIYRKRGHQPWETLSNGLEHPMTEMPYALLIPRDDPSTVYAGTRQGSLYVSDDQGDSWRKTDVNLPSILGLVHASGG
jgi:photosystem II stability/assembly factor-like uncharacterized protein